MGQSGSIVQVNHGYARNYLVPNKIATIQRGKQSGSIAPRAGAVFQSQHESVVSALSKEHQQEQQGTLSSEEEDAKQVENIQKAIKKLTSSTLVREVCFVKHARHAESSVVGLVQPFQLYYSIFGICR